MPLPAEGHTIDLSNPLDMLYLNGDKTELEKALKLFRKNGGLKRYRLAQSDNVQKVLEEIAAIGPDKISPILYESYSENLRKAVDQVFKRDSDTDLSDRLRANVSCFAAYKALKVTREVQQKLGEDIDEAGRVIRTYNRHQATEYNTTVSRSRTAKQFEQFNSPDSLRLFPNLRWLPSRSADPREQHMLFYNKVWAKDDDFWNENTPGSLWNCKCDWEETDDPVTQGNPQGNKSAKGLCGNPAKMGEVFTTVESENENKDKGYEAHPYFATQKGEKNYKIVYTTMRKSCMSFALKEVKGKMVERKELDKPILFSRNSINEYLNQPTDYYIEKNEFIRVLINRLKSAEYMGYTFSEGRTSYIFKTKIKGKICYLIANKSDDTNIYFHSVTFSNKVLNDINK